MEKTEFVEILECALLLFDNVSKEKIVNEYGLSNFSVSCAEHINNFIKSYKRKNG